MIYEISVRIYYEDTDLSGVVYHANYLKFFERGRTEAFRMTGLGHSDLLEMDPPLAFSLRRINVEFIKPARIDDVLLVRTKVTEAKGARMVFLQEMFREGELLATADVLAACMTLEGRPTRLPRQVVDYYAAQKQAGTD